jgi:predicted methyltransferase
MKHNTSNPPETASIARLSLHDPTSFSIQHSQTVHRLTPPQHWNISAGSKVLELGCGQGDCTTVLAHAVGGHERVAVDPADLKYGSSFYFVLYCQSAQD